MDLAPYVESLRDELVVAAEAGGEEARALAERLTATLESATRLALLEALSAAADEITRDLAPGSVDVRLRGRNPDFVVTSRPADSFDAEDEAGARQVAMSDRVASPTDGPPPAPPAPPDGDEVGMSRITLRLPEHVKARVEQAAGQAALSVNAWLVRAVAAALEPDDGDRRGLRRTARGGQHGQHYTGWVR